MSSKPINKLWNTFKLPMLTIKLLLTSTSITKCSKWVISSWFIFKTNSFLLELITNSVIKRLGLFPILQKCHDNAYSVELPPDLRISNTFNVADLYDYHPPNDALVSTNKSRTSFFFFWKRLIWLSERRCLTYLCAIPSLLLI